MRNLYRAFARLSQTPRPTLRTFLSHKYPGFHYCSFSSQTLHIEDGTMGKDKIQMSLKTPKGTQDCIFFQKLPLLSVEAVPNV